MGQFLGPETDRMCQFLGPETDVMGERYYIDRSGVRALAVVTAAEPNVRYFLLLLGTAIYGAQSAKHSMFKLEVFISWLKNEGI